jgi:hypothetical protein
MNRLILVAMIFAVSPALAHEEPPECTTTTTVRCTGSAAPYAVQPPPAPAAPQPIVVAPPPPAAAPPPPAYYPAPAPILLDLRKLEEGGWKVTQGSDGSIWRERRISTGNAAVWGTGLALFTVSYLGTAISAVTAGAGDEQNPLGFLPVLGGFINAIGASVEKNCSYSTGYYYDYQGCSVNKGAVAGYAIGGLAQAAGMITFFAGLSTGPKKLERQPISIGPGAFGSGGGLTLSGRFE